MGAYAVHVRTAHGRTLFARKALVRVTSSDERARASLFDVIKPSFELIKFAVGCAYCPYVVSLSPPILFAQEKRLPAMRAWPVARSIFDAPLG